MHNVPNVGVADGVKTRYTRAESDTVLTSPGSLRRHVVEQLVEQLDFEEEEKNAEQKNKDVPILTWATACTSCDSTSDNKWKTHSTCVPEERTRALVQSKIGCAHVPLTIDSTKEHATWTEQPRSLASRRGKKPPCILGTKNRTTDCKLNHFPSFPFIFESCLLTDSRDIDWVCLRKLAPRSSRLCRPKPESSMDHKQTQASAVLYPTKFTTDNKDAVNTPSPAMFITVPDECHSVLENWYFTDFVRLRNFSHRSTKPSKKPESCISLLCRSDEAGLGCRSF